MTVVVAPRGAPREEKKEKREEKRREEKRREEKRREEKRREEKRRREGRDSPKARAQIKGVSGCGIWEKGKPVVV